MRRNLNGGNLELVEDVPVDEEGYKKETSCEYLTLHLLTPVNEYSQPDR